MPPIQLVQASAYPCHDSEHPSSESQLGLKDFISLCASTMTRLECLIVTGYIHQGAQMQKSANPWTPYAKQHSQGPSRRWGRKIGRARKSGTCSELLAASEGVPPKCHQHAHAELTWARMAPMCMPNWWRKNARPQTPHQELQTRREDGSRGGGFSQKRAHWLSSSAKWSAPKTSMQATMRVPLDRHVCVYTHTYM